MTESARDEALRLRMQAGFLGSWIEGGVDEERFIKLIAIARQRSGWV
jgi:hypothetical protein